MRHQYVGVDVWKMAVTSLSYLALAFTVWVFLRLVNACFWLPSYLTKQQANVTRLFEDKLKSSQFKEEENIEDEEEKEPLMKDSDKDEGRFKDE